MKLISCDSYHRSPIKLLLSGLFVFEFTGPTTAREAYPIPVNMRSHFFRRLILLSASFSALEPGESDSLPSSIFLKSEISSSAHLMRS